MRFLYFLIAMAITSSLTFAGNVGFGQQVNDQVTTAQKIQMIQQLRADISSKRSEIANAKAKYLNGQLYFQIGDIGSSITGWTAFLVGLLGKSVDPKTRSGKIFWGTLAGYAVTKVMEVHYKEVVSLRKADKDRLERDLSDLEERLKGLETGLAALERIQ